MQPVDIETIVDNAIDRQEFSAGRESVFEVLRTTAPNRTDYWVDIANELHSRNRFYDALDCWIEAEKHLVSDDDVEEFYSDMSRTLDNAYDQTDDIFFKERALRALKRSHEIKPSSHHAKQIIKMNIQIGKPVEEIRRLVENAFEYQDEFKNGLELPRNVLGKDYWGDDIYTISDLAEVYLWENNLGEAFRIWSKCVTDMNDKKMGSFTRSIFAMVSYAQDKKLPVDDYLPDNLDFDSERQD
jgi:tetratricopeptide (TPR) repeat protein